MRPRHTWLHLASIVFLFGCTPLFMSRSEVEITGEFRADGSCSVSVNNSPVFGVRDSARTQYEIGDPGAAPDGYEQRFLMCEALRDIQKPLLRGLTQQLFLIFNIPRGTQTSIGNYEVRDPNIQNYRAGTIGGLLFDSRYEAGTRGSGFGGAGGEIHLKTVSGTVTFVRLDTTHAVIGTFRMRARREWSM